MFARIVIAAAVVLAALAFVAATGFLVAHRQGNAMVRARVVEPADSLTIDLRPAVYADLPAPVRRYFDFAFNGRTEVSVRWVDWSERGDFLLPVGRFQVRGRQRSRANAPAYAWTGTFWRFGLPVIESRDAFFVDDHDMRAKLFGWLTAMHTNYAEPAARASLHSHLLLRYYGQAPLMPWALLPNDNVVWRPNDATSAYLEITRDGLEGRYLVTFGVDGRIERMETDRLLLEGNHTLQREVGLKLDYAEINGFRVPTRMDYRWTLEDGSLSSHYDFAVKAIRILP
jgi:hypothetical protein